MDIITNDPVRFDRGLPVSNFELPPSNELDTRGTTTSGTAASTIVAQSVPVPQSNDPASFAAAHRRLLSDLRAEANTIGFNPLDAAQSALNRLGSATGLFDMQMSPQQRVGVLTQAYGEAIERHALGDPAVPRSMLTELHGALNTEISAIKSGNARNAALGWSIGAGALEFVRSTSVGLAAGVGSLIGGPATGALAGGLQSLGTLAAMTGSAGLQGIPPEQLDLPARLVGDVGNIFTTLAGPKLLAFFGLPGAPTADTMRAIAAHMGRQGAIDGGLDGLFTTVSEATVGGKPLPEALRAGAATGLISFFASGAFNGPTGFLDARQQGQMADVVRNMTRSEADDAVRALDPTAANRMRNEQPILYRALDERTNGGLTDMTSRPPHAAGGAANPGRVDAPPSRRVSEGLSPADLQAQRAADAAAQRQATMQRNQQALDTSVSTSTVGRTVQANEANAVAAARSVNDAVRTQNDAFANAGDPRRALDVAIPVRGTIDGQTVDFNLRGSPLALENEVARLKAEGVVPRDFDVARAAAQTGTPWNTLRQAELDIRANNMEIANGTTLFGSTVGVEIDAGEAMRRATEINAQSSGADRMALYIPLESDVVGSAGAGGTGRAFSYYENTPDNIRGFFDAMVDQGRYTPPPGMSDDRAFEALLEQSGIGMRQPTQNGTSWPERLDAALDVNHWERLPEIGGQKPYLLESEDMYQQFRTQARETNAAARDAFLAGDGSRIDDLSLVVPAPGARGTFAENLTRGEAASLLNAMMGTDDLVRDGVGLNDIIAANNLQGLVGVADGRAVPLDPHVTLGASRPGQTVTTQTPGGIVDDSFRVNPPGTSDVPPTNAGRPGDVVDPNGVGLAGDNTGNNLDADGTGDATPSNSGGTGDVTIPGMSNDPAPGIWTPDQSPPLTTQDDLVNMARQRAAYARETGQSPPGNYLLQVLNRDIDGYRGPINDVHSHEGGKLDPNRPGSAAGAYDPGYTGTRTSEMTDAQWLESLTGRFIEQSTMGDTVMFPVAPLFQVDPLAPGQTRGVPFYYAARMNDPTPRNIIGEVRIEGNRVFNDSLIYDNQGNPAVTPFEMTKPEFEALLGRPIPPGTERIEFVNSAAGCQLHFGGPEVDQTLVSDFATIARHEIDTRGTSVIPDRYVLGLTAGNPRDPEAARDVFTSLGYVNDAEAQNGLQPGSIRVLRGETNLSKELVHSLGGQTSLAENTPEELAAIRNWAESLGQTGMPIIIHCDSGTPAEMSLNTTGSISALRLPSNNANIERLIDLANQTPDAQIVWAHAGLGFTVEMPQGYLDTLRSVLEGAPNVDIDLSWDAIHRYIKEDPRGWAQLIAEYPDRFIFGSDTIATTQNTRPNSRFDVVESFAGTGLIREMNRIDPELAGRVFAGNYDESIRPGLDRVVTFRTDPENAEWLANGSQGEPPNIWTRNEAGDLVFGRNPARQD